jgi:hypothetical protein
MTTIWHENLSPRCITNGYACSPSLKYSELKVFLANSGDCRSNDENVRRSSLHQFEVQRLRRFTTMTSSLRTVWPPLLLWPQLQRPTCQIRWYATIDKTSHGKVLKFDRRDDERLKALQSWLHRFTPHTFPREVCTVTFSRSSGPGGQNVNK